MPPSTSQGLQSKSTAQEDTINQRTSTEPLSKQINETEMTLEPEYFGRGLDGTAGQQYKISETPDLAPRQEGQRDDDPQEVLPFDEDDAETQ